MGTSSAFRRVVAPLLIVAATVVQASPAISGGSVCMGGKKDALIRGRFSGPVICSNTAAFAFVGRTAGSPAYAVYDYRYRYMAPTGHVMHGGQKLVIFRGDDYLGQYSLSPPPYTAISVRGAYVRLRKHGAEAVMADFSEGPPPSIYFDGETENFYR